MEDIFYPYKKYYTTSPQWFRYICGNLYRKLPVNLRYGKIFSNTYKFLQSSQWWSLEKIRAYQWVKIKNLLEHAYNNIPFYKKMFIEKGIKPEDIRNFDDFHKVPLLTKELIRSNLNELIAQNYRKYRLLKVTTGGSTGTPLSLYYEKGVSRSIEQAFVTNLWNRVGYKLGEKIVILRGEPASCSSNSFWEYMPIKNKLILSIYHMIDENLPSYIRQIRYFKPKYFHVYPSALTILAKFMKKNNIPSFQNLKAIFSSSEDLYTWQIELFKNVFNCPIITLYGQVEMAVFAGNCECSNYYHIYPEYSYVELIDRNNKPIRQEKVIGEIVGTTFNNYVMPLIRYRTQDFASYIDYKCECGKNHVMLERIEGRLQEFVVTKNDALVTLTGLIFGQHFKAFEKIKQMQIEQSEKGKVLMRIIREKNYCQEDEDEIKFKIQQVVGQNLEINIAYISEIPRTKSGKYQFLIQKLPIKFGYISF